jgi:hypothetical protein
MLGMAEQDVQVCRGGRVRHWQNVIGRRMTAAYAGVLCHQGAGSACSAYGSASGSLFEAGLNSLCARGRKEGSTIQWQKRRQLCDVTLSLQSSGQT